MGDRPSVIARLLAPSALLLAVLAFAVVIVSSGVFAPDEAPTAGEGASGGEPGRSEPQRSERPPARSGRERPASGDRASGAATYTVKTGDTLASIAERTGVSVERLQELNPELDPQALVSGQKIKLRE